MLRALAEADIQWSAVHVWQTDERVAPMDDPDRTWTQIESALLSRLPHGAVTTHPMPVEAHDLTAAAARYADAFRKIAGTPPVLDVIHLGLGTDGHTASLVPHDPVLDERETDVAATERYRGHRRMTLTYPAINRARDIVWLVTGEDKADVLRRFCAGDATIPAGRVNRARAIVLADQAAAAMVDARFRG
jgi:6-phosphogluconolactonase